MQLTDGEISDINKYLAARNIIFRSFFVGNEDLYVLGELLA